MFSDYTNIGKMNERGKRFITKPTWSWSAATHKQHRNIRVRWQRLHFWWFCRPYNHITCTLFFFRIFSSAWSRKLKIIASLDSLVLLLMFYWYLTRSNFLHKSIFSTKPTSLIVQITMPSMGPKNYCSEGYGELASGGELGPNIPHL